MASERKARRFIAVDETCVKVNGEQYWVYSALDIERNESICMKVYSTRNPLTSESFIRSVLRLCDGKPEFIVDNASWLRDALTQAKEPNRIGILIIQTTHKNLLQQNNSQPKT